MGALTPARLALWRLSTWTPVCHSPSRSPWLTRRAFLIIPSPSTRRGIVVALTRYPSARLSPVLDGSGFATG